MKKTKLDSQAIPSLDEIQRLYEDLLRREAGEEKRDGGQKTGEFFTHFRKYESQKQSIDEENSLLRKYQDYLSSEKNKQRRAIEDLENRIDYEKFFWKWKEPGAKKTIRATSPAAIQQPATESRKSMNILSNYKTSLQGLLKPGNFTATGN